MDMMKVKIQYFFFGQSELLNVRKAFAERKDGVLCLAVKLQFSYAVRVNFICPARIIKTKTANDICFAYAKLFLFEGILYPKRLISLLVN
jgi:hypothetical protein